MSSTKEHQTVRPHSQHRLSASSNLSSNLPIRHQSSRHHSHSVSLGTLNTTHRVTRRKSMTSTGANTAAIAAALNGSGQPASQFSRQTVTTKGSSNGRVSEFSPGIETGPQHSQYLSNTYDVDNALDDDDLMQDDDMVARPVPHGRADSGVSKARARRASEGAYLSKNEGKRASGELRCMNQDNSQPPNTAKTVESDHSSASPDVSASSELHDDDISSAETTPPPVNDPADYHDRFGTARVKRNSGTSSAFSRSYQSAPSSSFRAGSIPLSSYAQQDPNQRRPSTSGPALTSHPTVDEDEAGLAAAVQSLCSFGTPRSGPVHLPPGVPPVPPLPAQYAGHNMNRLSTNAMTPTLHDFAPPPTASQRISNERGSSKRASRTAYRSDEEDFDQSSKQQTRNEDDEEGVFGRMDV
ncbi:MAG: hypothetical protein Q9188_002830 [Gyalolechia gomerana]